jgi:hypothetical protein
VFTEQLGISREILLELTREGPRRLVCPGCSRRMTLTLARGVQVDLCSGCGGAWLDDGELTTLTRGTLTEVGAAPDRPTLPSSAPSAGSGSLLDQARAAFGPLPGAPVAAPPPRPDDSGSGLELERAPRQPRPAPVALEPDHAPELPVVFASRRAVGAFEVCCIHCEQPLDLAQTNWLINQRPWCPACAAPHTGLSGMATSFATAALSVFAGRRLTQLSTSISGSMLGSADAMKVPPEQAEAFFGPFFRPVRPR